MTMQTLYDSDTFVVVHMVADEAGGSAHARQPQLVRHGFEIVDKRYGKEVFLEGLWADLFEERLQRWREKAPSQDEIEATLEGYAQLAQAPVVLH